MSAPGGGAAPCGDVRARGAAADARVLERHRDLPGLGVLLDPGALDDAVRPLLVALGREPVTGAVVDRLRLKGSASARAAVLVPPVAPGGRPVRLLVTALAGAWTDKAGKDRAVARRAGLPAHVLEEQRLVVVPMAADRDLRRLAGLRPDTGEAVRVRSSTARAAADLGAVRPVTLSYNPGRRWVGRLDPADGPGPGAPLLLRLHAHGRAETDRWRPGRPWRPEDGTAVVRAALEVGLVRRRPAPAAAQPLSGALLAAAAGLDALDDGWGRRGRALARSLAPVLGALPVAPAHGDLSPDQVVVDAGVGHVLDWDRAGVLPRGWDAASWSAAQVALQPGAPVVGLGGAAAPPAVVAAAHLLRAVEPFRRRRPGWDAGVEALLARAEAAVSEGGR